MVRYGFLIGLALLGVLAVARLDFSTDITHFMPDDGRVELAVISRRLATSALSRTMTLTIGAQRPQAQGTEESGADAAGAPNAINSIDAIDGTDATDATDAIAAAAHELTAMLAIHPEVAWVRDGSNEEFGEEVWRLYFPRRFYFASLRPEADMVSLTADAQLARLAAAAKTDLASPVGMLTKLSIERDPLGLFARIVERMTTAGNSGPNGAGLVRRNGRLWSRDGQAVIFVSTRSSAFASGPQGELLDAVAAAFAGIVERSEIPLVLERGGANRFAVDAERSIRRDVYRIAVLSVIGVVGIFIGFFPSPARLLLVLLPALAGIVAATWACLVLFGRIDGLTLAFGSSLIGVAIDYPIHLLNHQGLVTPSIRESVRRLAATLSLGAATTIASFAGLALTSFPGFREIGVFAMTGVAVALAVTLLVVPLFPSATFESPARARSLAFTLDRLVAYIRAQRRLLAVSSLVVVVIAGLSLRQLVWEDDLAKLNRIDPILQAEEDRVRARVSSYESGRFVVAVGDDVDAALQTNEHLQATLRRLIDTGALGAARSPSDFIWSVDLQRRNLDFLRAIPDLADRAAAAYEAAGFRVGVVDAFAKELAAYTVPGNAGEHGDSATAAVAPLRTEDLVGTGVGALMAGLIVDSDVESDGVIAITQLGSIKDEGAVRAAVEPLAGTHFLDQRDLANRLYAAFRWRTLRQIALGCLLVLVLLLVRYRSWRPAAAAFLPSALVALLVPSLLAMMGVSLNLLHAVSLMMVMGMGVDYGIFLVDGMLARESAGAITLSLLLSCLTTVMVFGVLALSSNPALAAIGWTTGLGVSLSFILAPVALIVLEQRP
jgi:predicted exporter